MLIDSWEVILAGMYSNFIAPTCIFKFKAIYINNAGIDNLFYHTFYRLFISQEL